MATCASPSRVSSSACSEKVPAPRPSTTPAVNSRSTSSLVASSWTPASGRAPMTSGSRPAAAEEISSWLNWFGSTATSSTSTPLLPVKAAAISSWTARRSGRFSRVHTVSGSPSSLPPVSPPPQAASRTVAPTAATETLTRRCTTLISSPGIAGLRTVAANRVAWVTTALWRRGTHKAPPVTDKVLANVPIRPDVAGVPRETGRPGAAALRGHAAGQVGRRALLGLRRHRAPRRGRARAAGAAAGAAGRPARRRRHADGLRGHGLLRRRLRPGAPGRRGGEHDHPARRHRRARRSGCDDAGVLGDVLPPAAPVHPAPLGRGRPRGAPRCARPAGRGRGPGGRPPPARAAQPLRGPHGQHRRAGRRTARATGWDSVRVGADTYHMNIEEADPLAALRADAARIGHVQLSDSNRLEPGAGHLDWTALLACLDEIGYAGWLAFECRLSGNPARVLPRATAMLRSALQAAA